MQFENQVFMALFVENFEKKFLNIKCPTIMKKLRYWWLISDYFFYLKFKFTFVCIAMNTLYIRLVSFYFLNQVMFGPHISGECPSETFRGEMWCGKILC